MRAKEAQHRYVAAANMPVVRAGEWHVLVCNVDGAAGSASLSAPATSTGTGTGTGSKQQRKSGRSALASARALRHTLGAASARPRMNSAGKSFRI